MSSGVVDGPSYSGCAISAQPWDQQGRYARTKPWGGGSGRNVKNCLPDIHRMTGFRRLILPPSATIGNPGPSSWGQPGTKVGDDCAFGPRNVNFAFIRPHLSHGFRSNAWINESFMPALDEAAAAVTRLADFLERNPNALITGKKHP